MATAKSSYPSMDYGKCPYSSPYTPFSSAYSHANLGKDKRPPPIAYRNHPIFAHPDLTAFPHSLRWMHRPRTPEAEILSHKPKHMPEAKAHPQKPSEQQSDYHENVLVGISRFPTSRSLRYDNVCSYGKCSNIGEVCKVIEFPSGVGAGVSQQALPSLGVGRGME